uniref:Putative secreted protein n=1 Tax=Anopheles darlingi TaxID=43151 RepID=A0A2M4D849_ANODA
MSRMLSFVGCFHSCFPLSFPDSVPFISFSDAWFFYQPTQRQLPSQSRSLHFIFSLPLSSDPARTSIQFREEVSTTCG